MVAPAPSISQLGCLPPNRCREPRRASLSPWQATASGHTVLAEGGGTGDNHPLCTAGLLSDPEKALVARPSFGLPEENYTFSLVTEHKPLIHPQGDKRRSWSDSALKGVVTPAEQATPAVVGRQYRRSASSRSDPINPQVPLRKVLGSEGASLAARPPKRGQPSASSSWRGQQ